MYPRTRIRDLLTLLIFHVTYTVNIPGAVTWIVIVTHHDGIPALSEFSGVSSQVGKRHRTVYRRSPVYGQSWLFLLKENTIDKTADHRRIFFG